MPTTRLTNLIVFLGCAGLILAALYFQHVLDMEPCPLCITQRIFVIAVGLVGLVAFLHNPRKTGQTIYSVLAIALAAGGGFFAARHAWLQTLPEDQLPACGPSLEYMLETFPLGQALQLLLMGDGNCGQVSWRFIGLTMPGWVLLAFIGLAAINVWQIVRRS